MSSSNIIRLCDATPGQCMCLTSIEIEGVMRRRLLDLGFVPGAIVEVVRVSPLGDPVAYRVSQTIIALRKEESMRIKGELMSYDS